MSIGALRQRGSVLLSALLVLLFAVVADAAPEDVRAAVEEALLRGDDVAAAQVLDELATQEPAVPDDLLAGAQIALSLISGVVGESHATTLLLRSLARKPDHRPSWDLTQTLRERLMSELRYDTGTRLIEGLITIYPDVPHYIHHLATLRMNCGHADMARDGLLSLVEMTPSNTDVYYDLATIEEGLGLYDESVARYKRIIELSGDLHAHFLKTRLLWHKKRDFEAARAALEAGAAATRDAEPGRTREYYLERFDSERDDLYRAIDRRERLLAFDARLDRLLLGFGAMGLLGLTAGISLMRRRRLI